MSDPPRSKQRPLRSALAAVQHDIWAHWMRYLFSVGDRVDDGSVLIPADKVKRWERQIHADYDDLSEEEQASDLEQADKVLSVFDVVAYDAPEYMKGPEWDEWLEDSARTLVGEDKRWGLMSSRGACKLDVYTAIQQAKAYAPARPPFVAISNPGLRAVECRDLMPVICAQVRAITGAKWLHNLGAGWDMADIHAWRNLGCFDSIDSIAYYTAAQDGFDWSGREAATWPERAVHNALAAQHTPASVRPISEIGHQPY